MLKLIFIITSIIGICCTAIKEGGVIRRNDIYKVYISNREAEHADQTLTLYNNGGYFYTDISPHYKISSEGMWRKEGNELILTSILQSDSIPFTVVEQIKDDDSVTVQPVLAKRGNIVKGARILINGNKSFMCMPFIESCKQKKGKIESIQILIGDRCTTRVYKIKEINSTSITIMIDSEYDLEEEYEFLEQFRFIIKDTVIITKSLGEARMPFKMIMR